MKQNRDTLNLNRREFISLALASAAGVVAAGGARADEAKAAEPKASAPESPRLIASAPVLQNAAATTMDVAFAVSADACGWVEVARSPDMAGARRVWAGRGGLREVSDKIALVRIRGLEPATTYYYRIGADRIEYKNGYQMRNLGPEADEAVHSFTTLGAARKGAFAVINDTHEKKPVLDAVFRKIAAIGPAVAVWNGDASNNNETIERAMKVFISPHPAHPAYAADTPYLFVPGNHDYRGRANRHLEEVVPERDAAERSSAFAELGRNFVERLGDTALIGLDTGEDKLDTNPLFAGIFAMKPYRELQTKWLAEAIESEKVKTARFKVVFCHIPLFDAWPQANPGDVEPADADPRYAHDYAIWQRTCASMWGPLFEKAGVQLVVAAHNHRFRVDEPAPGRPWRQIVGGGPDVDTGSWRRVPTVIEGREEDGRLAIRVHDAEHDKVIYECAIG